MLSTQKERDWRRIEAFKLEDTVVAHVFGQSAARGYVWLVESVFANLLMRFLFYFGTVNAILVLTGVFQPVLALGIIPGLPFVAFIVGGLDIPAAKEVAQSFEVIYMACWG